MIIRDTINKDLGSIYEVVSLAFKEEQNVRDGEIIEARLVKELIKDNDDRDYDLRDFSCKDLDGNIIVFSTDIIK